LGKKKTQRGSHRTPGRDQNPEEVSNGQKLAGEKFKIKDREGRNISWSHFEKKSPGPKGRGKKKTAVSDGGSRELERNESK